MSVETLSAYLDGDLSLSERARVEDALASDPAARQALEELRQVKHTAGLLAMETPAERVWDVIEAALDAFPSRDDAAVRQAPGLLSRIRGWMADQWGPVVLTTSLAAGVIWVVQTSSPAGDGSVAQTEPHVSAEGGPSAEAAVEMARLTYEKAISALEREAATATRELPEETRVELRLSLQELDEAIAHAERVLRGPELEPRNESILLALYDEKVRILREVLRFQDERGSP
ncbi:MAG: zf-HC2 domain-containing protein [Myxococcota bacterium]